MSAELELARRRRGLPPAEITTPAEAELELRRHQALLDVMRRGRADQREQVVVLRRCVEYAVRGADLVDEMRAAGELADGTEGVTASELRTRSVLTLSDVGLTRQRVAEWRSLRDHDALAFLDEALADDRYATFARVGLQWVRERVERVRREEQAAAADPEPAYDYELRHGDLRTALDDLAGTVDAIITDPPYGAAHLDEYDALGEVAARLLTPTGVLVVMVGQANLPRYLERLQAHLVYRWTGAYLTRGPATRVRGPNVGSSWKPLLIFDRGHDKRRFLMADVFESAGADKAIDGQRDGWTQSESGTVAIVERVSGAGELVVDPFLGAGTTAFACRALGRRFVGCDVDPDAVAITRRRLAA